MGRIPDPPPMASPARREANGFDELSKPDMIEDVGEERPRRAELCGYRDT
jgi:hypothetical protein